MHSMSESSLKSLARYTVSPKLLKARVRSLEKSLTSGGVSVPGAEPTRTTHMGLARKGKTNNTACISVVRSEMRALKYL